ncbi:G-patch RNA maturation protein [Purpureocillium lavendulum]|uniref:PinX1-related protein 1 n=1 Tax=Purpureocillium lavendulum TaxID=1247861 RepID=A0AB34G4R8_9HYPO|nr:G-patch RNA maturation protein [Purpureocillium lavendulum]
MGLLAESKSRGKINKDPNNTKWTRDTTTFGQKMLRAHGWQPGQFLGAQGAAHSELHTAANASYIRVSVKDDVKGLGWSKSKEDEVTGLDVFSDLLSRLNGKSEESLEGERQARLIVKTNQYVEQKYGPMRFVRGGFLVGDSMKELVESSTPTEEAPQAKREKKSKKRKASDVEDADGDSESDAKKEKRRRKEEKRAKKAAADSTPEADDSARADGKKKKSKKDKSPSDTDEAKAGKKRKSKSKQPSSEESDAEEPKKSKKDKKEKKKRKKAEAGEESTEEAADSSAAPTGASTPSGSGTGTSTPRGTRNFVRSRFIAAKRQAMLDTKALNQIFMVKT